MDTETPRMVVCNDCENKFRIWGEPGHHTDRCNICGGSDLDAPELINLSEVDGVSYEKGNGERTYVEL